MEPKNKSVKEAILNKSWKQLIGKSVTLIDTLIVTDYKTNKNIKLNPGDIVKIIDSARANSNIKDDVAFIEFKGKIYVSTPEPLLNKSNLNEENMKTKKNLKESSDIERQITKYIQKKFAFRSNLLDKNSSEEDVEYYAQQIQQDLKIPDYNYQFIISCLKKYYNIRESKQLKESTIDYEDEIVAPSWLQKGHEYVWIMGAEPLLVRYNGRGKKIMTYNFSFIDNPKQNHDLGSRDVREYIRYKIGDIPGPLGPNEATSDGLNKFKQESKQFSLAQTVKKILKESEYKSKLDKQFKNEHDDLSIIKRNVIKSDNSGPYATTAKSIDEYDVVSLSEKKYDENYILNWAREIWKSSYMVDRKVDKVMAFKDMWTVTVTTTVWQN